MSEYLASSFVVLVALKVVEVSLEKANYFRHEHAAGVGTQLAQGIHEPSLTGALMKVSWLNGLVERIGLVYRAAREPEESNQAEPSEGTLRAFVSEEFVKVKRVNFSFRFNPSLRANKEVAPAVETPDDKAAVTDIKDDFSITKRAVNTLSRYSPTLRAHKEVTPAEETPGFTLTDANTVTSDEDTLDADADADNKEIASVEETSEAAVTDIKEITPIEETTDVAVTDIKEVATVEAAVTDIKEVTPIEEIPEMAVTDIKDVSLIEETLPLDATDSEIEEEVALVEETTKTAVTDIKEVISNVVNNEEGTSVETSSSEDLKDAVVEEANATENATEAVREEKAAENGKTKSKKKSNSKKSMKKLNKFFKF